MIDKGVNIGLPFSGTNPDLGAFEFSLTSDILTNAFRNTVDIYYHQDTRKIQIGDYCGKIQVYNLFGKLILTLYENQINSMVSIDHLKPGIYFIHHSDKTGIKGTIKILVE